MRKPLRSLLRKPLRSVLFAAAVGGAVAPANPYRDVLIVSTPSQSNMVGQGVTSVLDGGVTAKGLGLFNAFPAGQLAHHCAPGVADPPVFTDIPSTPSTFRDLQPYGTAPAAGLGDELSLIRKLVATGVMNTPIHFGKFAINGLPISNLLPAASYPTTPPNLWSRWVSWVRACEANCGKPAKIFIKRQGESDCDSDAEVAAWGGRLTTEINAIRAEFGTDTLIFIALIGQPQVGGITGGMTQTRVDNLNAATLAVVATYPSGVHAVNMDDAPTSPTQREHYLANGHVICGNIIGHAIADAIDPTRDDDQGVGPAPYLQWNDEPSLGSDTAASGNFQVWGPVGGKDGDIEFLIVSTSSSASDADPPALTSAQGFTLVANATSQISTTTFANTSVYKRTVSEATLAANRRRMPAPTITDNTNRKLAMIVSVRGASGTGATATHGNNANGTAVNATGLTTTAPNSLVLFFQGGFSGAGATNDLTSPAASGLTGVAVKRDSYRPLAQFITIVGGTRATIGASGNLTGTRGAAGVFATVAVEILA